MAVQAQGTTRAEVEALTPPVMLELAGSTQTAGQRQAQVPGQVQGQGQGADKAAVSRRAMKQGARLRRREHRRHTNTVL